MDLKRRKRLSLLILLLGLPGYIIMALVASNWIYDRFGRQPIWVELILYIGLGIVWILPFRRIFSGVGKGEE